MTIGKAFLRLVALFLTLVLCLLSLASCQGTLADPPFELLDDDELPQEQILKTNYHVVVSSACSSELLSAAKELAERLFAQTGIPTEVVYDTEKSAASEEIGELLLGRCHRDTAKKALSHLRRDDYLCFAENGTTVLGGPTEVATLVAIDRFYEELLPLATEYSLLPSSVGFTHRAEYAISSITLNGFDLSEYTLVHDRKASATVIALLRSLQERLCSEGGYALALCSSAKVSESEKQILFSIDESTEKNTFCTSVEEQRITLSAPDLFGLSVAASRWGDRLLTPKEGQAISLSVNEKERVSYSHADHSVGSLWLNSHSNDVEEFTSLTDKIKQQSPALLLMNPMSALQQEPLIRALSNEYTVNPTNDLLRTDANCRLLSEQYDPTDPFAKLYQIGEGTDAFLFLSLDRLPTEPLPKELQNRNLPLLIVLETELDDLPSEERTFSEDRLALVHSETYLQQGTSYLFSVYAEIDCFTAIESYHSANYHSVTLRRLCACYPTPT